MVALLIGSPSAASRATVGWSRKINSCISSFCRSPQTSAAATSASGSERIIRSNRSTAGADEIHRRWYPRSWAATSLRGFSGCSITLQRRLVPVLPGTNWRSCSTARARSARVSAAAAVMSRSSSCGVLSTSSEMVGWGSSSCLISNTMIGHPGLCPASSLGIGFSARKKCSRKMLTCSIAALACPRSNPAGFSRYPAMTLNG